MYDCTLEISLPALAYAHRTPKALVNPVKVNTSGHFAGYGMKGFMMTCTL